MSADWEFYGSVRVMEFLSAQSAPDRRRLLHLLQSMADHPVVLPTDLARRDENGRPHWLRFQDGFAVMFWIDPWEKQLRVIDVGLV